MPLNRYRMHRNRVLIFLLDCPSQFRHRTTTVVAKSSNYKATSKLTLRQSKEEAK